MTHQLVTISRQIFYKVEGQTAVMGNRGPLYTYAVYVQRGLGMTLKDVVGRIDKTLADNRGWIRGKVRFQRVQDNPGTLILLCSPEVTDRICSPMKTEGKVSCCNGNRIALNIDRWKYGVPHWTGSVFTYRQMLINHEMGHRIGKGHSRCPGAGGVAPVMQQQTYGMQGCKCNPWPLTSELL